MNHVPWGLLLIQEKGAEEEAGGSNRGLKNAQLISPVKIGFRVSGIETLSLTPQHTSITPGHPYLLQNSFLPLAMMNEVRFSYGQRSFSLYSDNHE
ncbi:hypothetical protein TcasGA2_TC033080 [Tribolium castaneum]|uniref:Uncharacterized protein n=2 Tax=Tenebrionidae TaxID=7065 RepID=A0A139WI94_TRICA|nr:hypothetical protein TcasGA2_TC033080 [Tribolium castaneum]